MHSIVVPNSVETYVSDLYERALPDHDIASNDFYRRLAGWVIDTRTPLLYEQDHPDEYTNFSINFNWLLLRDYSNTRLGPPDTIKTMYTLHEFSHMTHRLATRLDVIGAEEYAEEFTRSEYRASNETEILIHYRMPELRKRVFPGMKIALDILRERGIEQPSSALLAALRPLVVEQDILDPYFQDTPENQEICARFKLYNGNREWAKERFQVIKPFFSGSSFPQSSGLSDREYEAVISAYNPLYAQDQYEANVIRNIRFGYAMCGLLIPDIKTFQEARKAADRLEGEHAIVQS